jgi:hypothetical protein
MDPQMRLTNTQRSANRASAASSPIVLALVISLCSCGGSGTGVQDANTTGDAAKAVYRKAFVSLLAGTFPGRCISSRNAGWVPGTFSISRKGVLNFPLRSIDVVRSDVQLHTLGQHRTNTATDGMDDRGFNFAGRTAEGQVFANWDAKGRLMSASRNADADTESCEQPRSEPTPDFSQSKIDLVGEVARQVAANKTGSLQCSVSGADGASTPPAPLRVLVAGTRVTIGSRTYDLEQDLADEWVGLDESVVAEMAGETEPWFAYHSTDPQGGSLFLIYRKNSGLRTFTRYSATGNITCSAAAT